MTRIGVILAGGASRRMGGEDKGALKLGGRRLVDHVAAKLAPQIDRLLIAGPGNYGLGCVSIADRRDGPAGPAAALWSAALWISDHEPKAAGFLTAPVDGPFLPDDLFEKLSADGGCAIATDDSGDHPTFAYWSLAVLMPVLRSLKTNEGVPLFALGKQCKVRRSRFALGAALMNINSPADLALAEKLLE